MLKREVEVRQEPGGLGEAVEEIVAAVHRLEGAQSECHVRPCRGPVERDEQVEQRERRAEVAAVRPEVNARHPQFLEPGIRGHPHLADHRFERPARACAPRARDDAIGAALVAARLHAEREGGPAPAAGTEGKLIGNWRTGELGNWGTGKPRNQGRRRGSERTGDARLDRIGDDLEDTGELGHFVGPSRRVAPGGDHAGGGVEARDAPDGAATTRSAASGEAGMPPLARSWHSMSQESAWFARQPKVRTQYFIAGFGIRPESY
jgi:hypothetical protein